jgi:hypothetical protein
MLGAAVLMLEIQSGYALPAARKQAAGTAYPD